MQLSINLYHHNFYPKLSCLSHLSNPIYLIILPNAGHIQQDVGVVSRTIPSGLEIPVIHVQLQRLN